MKIKKLDIHNIASIRDAVIDFDANPLRDSNVFLISGKTGAGKTTILDAICLALYNEVPRLIKVNDGKIEDAELARNDTRNLMRQDTGEAYVKLTFVGIDNKQYEAKWSVSRARNKVDGKIQPVKWSIEDIEAGTTIGGIRESENKILEVVGLTFDQFCRTTMLAQGEFTKFLKSEPKDKSTILEKIVGADIYSKVGAKIADITSEKKEKAEIAKAQQTSISLLNEDQKAEKLREIEELNKDNEQKKAVKESDTKKLQWLNEDSKNQQKLKQAQEEYEQAKKAIESDEFKASQQLVKQWDETISVRQSIDNKSAQDVAIKNAQEDIQRKHDQFEELAAGAQYLKEHVAQETERLNEIEEALNKLSAEQKDVYENVETDIANLKTIISTQQTVEQKKKEIGELNVRIEPLKKAYKEAQEAENMVQGKVDSKKNEYDEQQKALDDLHLNETRADEKAQSEIQHKIETAETSWADYDKVCEALKQQKQEIADKEAQLGELNDKVLKAEGVKEGCKVTLDRLCNTEADTIKKLRRHLLVGDNCPVCQAVVTDGLKANLPSDDAWDKLVNEAENAYNEAEKNYNKLVQDKNNLFAEIRAKQNNLPDVQKAKAEWENACKELNIKPNKEALDGRKERNKKTLIEISNKLKSGEDLESKVKDLRKEYDTLQDEYTKAQEKTKKQKESLDDCAIAISKAEEALKTSNNLIEHTKDALNPNIKKVYVDIQDWIVLRNTLRDESKWYNTQNTNKDALTQDIEKTKTILDQAKQRVDEIKNHVPAWNDLLSPKQYEGDLVRNLGTLNNDIFGLTTTITNAQKQRQQAVQSIEQWLASNAGFTEQRLLELSNWNSERITAKRKENESVATEFTDKKTIKENVEKDIRSHQENKPVLAEGETVEYLTKRIEEIGKGIDTNNEKIGTIRQELKQDEDNCKKQKEQQEEYERLRADYDKWQRVNLIFGTKDGTKFRTIAQSYILDYLIFAANEYMRQLGERYVLTLTPGTFGINVEDTWAGHTQRAVNTLSGGETFMVSLALALALSDIGSRNLQVDTLFIDEGFGTLSGEALDSAIAMLQNLQSKNGRRVGIISHVSAVKEKIPVHIDVERNGNKSYSTINIVPAVNN